MEKQFYRVEILNMHWLSCGRKLEMHKLLVFKVAGSTEVWKAWRVAQALSLIGLMKDQSWKGMLSRQHISFPHVQT